MKIQRSDGRVEYVCAHGVGHTISVPKGHKGEPAWWVHGCDGCCKERTNEEAHNASV